MWGRLRSFMLGTLRRQLTLGVVLVQAVLMSGFVWGFVQREQALRLEHEAAEAATLAASLAAAAAGWMQAPDLDRLRQVVQAQQEYPDLAYTMIVDQQGRVLALSGAERLVGPVAAMPVQAQPSVLTRTPELVDVAAPVVLAGRHLGWARVGLAPGPSTRAELADTARRGAFYAAAAIAVGALLAAWMAARLTRRLARIWRVADDVDRGDLSSRVALAGTDEAAHVGQALNRMLDGMVAARQALADSEQRLRLALEAAHLHAWRWNAATDDTEWGDDPQRLLGPRPPDGYEKYRAMVAPEDRALFMAASRQAVSGGADYSVEYRLQRTDGQVRWLVDRGRAVRDAAGRALHMIGVTQDVTERKAAEQLLHDSEARANLIIDSSPDALLLVGLDGRIVRVNSRVESLFGYGPAELVGRGIESLVPTRLRPSHPRVRDAFVGDPRSRVMGRMTEVLALRKDGSEFPVQINLALLGTGPAAQVIASVRDETQSRALQADLVRHRDHLEELVASRTAELTASRNEAERLARVKSEFLAHMSHEIRTPLNAVLGLAQVGVLNPGGGASAEARTAFAGIVDAGQHLLGVVDDILDFSRLDAGKLVVEQQVFELAAALSNATSLVAGAAQRKQLHFELNTAPGLPRWVRGDAQRLQQILINLLSNAVKFSEAGAVSLRVAHDGGGRHGGDGDEIYFKVVDAGIGITPEQVARLFMPFEQADSSTTRRFGGSGLGLAISQNLAQRMGGQISVDSTPGAGSTFTLRLPLPRVQPPAAEGAGAAVAAVAGQRLAGLRLLAAEDVEVNRLVLEAMLAHEGVQVVFADHGLQALERLQEAGADGFDAVLMDVQMPVMDGYEATRRMLAYAPGLPVIGLTAHAMAEERDKCHAAGMVAHLSKPVDLDTLVEAILRSVAARR